VVPPSSGMGEGFFYGPFSSPVPAIDCTAATPSFPPSFSLSARSPSPDVLKGQHVKYSRGVFITVLFFGDARG